MSKSLHLSIPEPCHEKWNKMSPSEQGRFCGACQKQVVDFTSMTDQELQSFFLKKNEGNVCGRFVNAQLNRDIQIPKKKLPWAKYVIQVAIPAMLYSTKAAAQGEVKVKGDTIVVRSEEMIMGKINPNRPLTNCENPKDTPAKPQPVPIFGIVTDVNGNPLSNVTVNIKRTGISTLTDSSGMYSLLVEKSIKPVDLVFSYVGYETLEKAQEIREEKGKVYEKTSLIETSDFDGIVVGLVVYVPPTSKKTIPLIGELVDTVARFFKPYPNPVMSGSNINIEWKGSEEGYFQLNLADQSGRIVHQREIWIDKDARLLNFNIPTVPAGQYLLTMANKKTGKIFTEKLLITQ